MTCSIARFAAVSLFAVTAPLAFAQDDGVDPITGEAITEEQSQYRLSLHGGLEHQFETGVDGGGDFSVTSYGGIVSMETDIHSDLTVLFRFSYIVDDYDFTSGVLDVPEPLEPWDDVHTASFTAAFSWHLDRDWTIFAGPVIQMSRETGADFDDSLRGGGSAGVVYRASRDLTIGGGLVIMSELDDNVRFAPIIILNWTITDDFAIRSTPATAALALQGVELVYKANRDWEFAVGGGYKYSRFRLDEESHTPGGVGEHSSTPIWFRAGWTPSNQFALNIVAGAVVGGELKLDDFNGLHLESEDYDTAFFAGFMASFRF